MSTPEAVFAPRAALRRLAPFVLPAVGCAVVGVAVLASRPTAGGPGPVTVASSPSPAAADPAVDYRDPAAVCGAFVRALYARDTATDSGPADAYRRAAAYADARYAQAIADPRALQLPDWQEWLDHRAAVAVDVQPLTGDIDVDATGHQVRAMAVTAVAQGRDGWTGQSMRTHVTCDLSPAPEGWRVGSYTLQVIP
jgi:hypothetical protein